MDRKFVQVERTRQWSEVEDNSEGILQGCINDVTEAILCPVPLRLLPGSGGRKVWNPT